ncbi:PRC and DUF2382 domain-containing protein [Actinoplanes sp. URMC 104]|uniref:PRC and DUF2382 domain-containing protein n=1 Tax=Actinoplanes sp. URMC 104 TaxID=3423409 RepID=UPI003F1C30AD
MITQDNLGDLSGAEVHDSAGERIGEVAQIYADPDSGQPQWVTVRTGTFSFQECFVPLQGARLEGGRLIVATTRDLVMQAPLLETGAPLDFDDADRLSAHYGMAPGTPEAAGGRHAAADTPGAETQAAADAPGAETPAAGGTHAGGRHAADDDAMTRSEERLKASTVREPVTKVRLRKYLVTEQRQVTVPVTREEVRLEEVPVTAADDPGAATGGEPGADATPDDMILHAEQPVVTTEKVPVERVRLAKDTVHEEQTISAPVRREKIEYDGPEPI